MLTNILLITLLIVLISGYVKLNTKIEDENGRAHCERNKLRILIEANDDMGYILTNKNRIDENHKLLSIIEKDYINRIELQEKLIADLKQTQAPQEVSDTVSLINEWMNGATVEKE